MKGALAFILFMWYWAVDSIQVFFPPRR